LTLVDADNIKKLNHTVEGEINNDTHIEYLEWLHKNWKHITPSDVGL
jgi:hypothetical protein